MIQPEVQEVASVFRGELRWMFGPYPALIPDSGWPSVGILDALCRGMRGRSVLTEGQAGRRAPRGFPRSNRFS